MKKASAPAWSRLRLSAATGRYVKHIGIGLKGVENVELSKGLPDSAKLTIALTGGLRFPIFELGFIGAKLSFPLTEPRSAEFSLDGLDVSLKLGPAVISGSFPEAASIRRQRND